ncbi:MAG TPA: protein kinase [Gemmatimonadales bacterium]|nr:protein kinase [Gemmatimonadales bacterium]
MKVLPFSLAFDREFVERFQREARTSAKLEHPNIIPIYRVGRTGRTSYFVMKYLRGRTLASVLTARGTLPPSEIRDILCVVCRALAYAHRQGVVHRDIKPDNIMFDEHGHAMVTDFGIAKAGTGGRLTGTGMAIGTPHFMSPEQAKALQIDGRSDLYSLGVVAYVCLTGGVPFDGEDSFSIGYKHIMEQLPEPELRTPDQRELFAIIRKLLAKTADERFQSAEEVLQAFEGAPVLSRTRGGAALAASGGELGSRPTSPMPRPSIGRTPTPVPTPVEHRSVAGSLVIFLLVVGAVLAGGGYWAHRQGLLPALGLGARDSLPAAGGVSGPAPVAIAAVGPDTAPGDSVLPGTGDSARAAPPAPGRLLLTGVPRNARVLLDGQLVGDTALDVPAGPHLVSVALRGTDTWEREVTVPPGGFLTVAVPRPAPRVDPCGDPGPAYNPGGICFDSRPMAQMATTIPIPADAPMMPREAILYVKVSREGGTLDARIFSPSNDATFNEHALDLAKIVRWNPAQKNGEPVEAWTQLRVVPVRQP